MSPRSDESAVHFRFLRIAELGKFVGFWFAGDRSALRFLPRECIGDGAIILNNESERADVLHANLSGVEEETCRCLP